MNVPVIQGFRAPYLSNFHPFRSALSYTEFRLSLAHGSLSSN
ncbi:hypothetical protein [Vibrio porteresiae]|uniref:Uncharacterized protein n=1 Tax=Vibrio porteresiae DSM 19223 TaxID=1123496 RepID=A0ABZ0QFS4_9VIBR|nr:hypothetical protein [Vibrio porteresiae]WPC75342.1 hypothetical protein R8Z52_10685 [Vibrio porteresiae DSM 19223]